ncbi:PHP domain-containing protein [Alteribacillus sp. YIM 98480]|uniref:PHP domain-containing protein n=1 Tax=Alteribacillus sp. YIM 98480 TaxID=2606599 RepID=UPI00131B7594
MIDLHCHTKISDNTMSIREIIALAAQKGVTHLAITDHDTTAGLEQASIIGEQLNVSIIPGIEISAFDFKRNRRAHILGYYVNQGNADLITFCKPMLQKRHQASYNMVNSIIKAGYDITWEDVLSYAEGSTAVYKQHIMHALIDKGYTDEIYSPLYKTLFSADEKDGEAGIAHMSIEYLDAVEAIRKIRAAGGVPVLAHPGQFDNFEAISEWVEEGLEGIEVFHPLHNKETEELAKQYAEQYNLIQTGGSDFHGKYGPSQEYPLGCKSPGEESAVHLMKRADESVKREIKL